MNIIFTGIGDATPQAAEETEVLQGYLVNQTRSGAADDGSDKARRSYEAAQKIFQAYDRLLSRSANELGHAGLDIYNKIFCQPINREV